MKRILGLDLGTTSIGWALVEETRNDNKKLIDANIIKLGVRVIPLSVDEKTAFEKGQTITTNADRTIKRSARRNLQRFKLRRSALKELLLEGSIIQTDTILTEDGKNSTHETLLLRAKAAKERIELNEFARVLFAINKKRGYKSSRKTKGEDDGVAVDGMAVAKELYEKNLTPGQYALSRLNSGKTFIPDFYRSDLQTEFDRIWSQQKIYYPNLLTNELYTELQNKNKKQTWAICQKPFNIEGIKLDGKKDQQRIKRYELRVKGLNEKLDLEHLAIALQEVNNDKNKSSGYLGEISDRSKELYTDRITVGEYLWKQIEKNPHTSLKRQVFYRQDYLDEFEQIWNTQSKYHPELSAELKDQIRDTVIFYQRKLKSQKGLISFCQFESWKEERKNKNGEVILNKSTGLPKKHTVGQRVIPKSSPLFQEFRIWQNINNLVITSKDKHTDEHFDFDEDAKELLFQELNIRKNLTEKQALKVLGLNDKEWKTNQPILDRKKGTIKPLEGNRTNASLFEVYQEIATREGYGFDWAKSSARKIIEELKAIFNDIGINPEILSFNSNIEGSNLEKQLSYQLWHLLYSAEDDEKTIEADRLTYGNSDVNLKKALHLKFGFKPDYTKLIAGVSLESDYGNLSARAIRKLLPYMQSGHPYSQNEDKEKGIVAGAIQYVYGKKPITKKYDPNKALELFPKNSLRNPVVEKILNQMINLINQISESYGKPNEIDEIRIELARELKKSSKERGEATKAISAATKVNDDIRKTIQKDFGFTPTKNDVIRYKLWKELVKNGGRTLFTDQKIEAKDLFTKKIDIEHIIPKALLFDDSFSNKTLAFRDVNQQKDKRTAYDFIQQDYTSEFEKYKNRVERLYDAGAISKSKRNKLLMPASKLPEGFIERDLRNSQYIAKKAKALLEEVFKTVVPTTGSITDKLREDWGLINVMKELNLPKYKKLGLTETQVRWDSGKEKEKQVEIIKDWTKRNDHRHHAMDALAVAFTSHNHIQYINYLNARENENHKKHGNIIAIEHDIKENGKFLPPMVNFRSEAKKHIESILVSHKAKNKVVTRNINKAKGNHPNRIQLTPRGQLHKETIYGKSKQPQSKPTKLNKKFEAKDALLIIHPVQKQIVIAHLEKFGTESAKAFDSKTLKQHPLLFNEEPLREVLCFEEVFTIRKDITPDNFKDLKAINKIIDLKTRNLLIERFKNYDNDPKLAFSDLKRNPIWLNKEKGISIKRTTIKGVSNAEALHTKRDHYGNELKNKSGKPIASDFVSTGNNHHVAIFKDEKGNLQEEVVSFYEAVARSNQNEPVIRKIHPEHPNWEFQFTMKQNEYFVFPNEETGFNPNEIDLLDPANCAIISPHLYRVQKIASKNYFFRHHLETTVETQKELNGIAYKAQLGLSGIIGVQKLRINHLGQIKTIGE